MSNFKRVLPPAQRLHPVPGYRQSALPMSDSKAILPAEIITQILDYLLIPDLFSFARTSQRMREMVYEDSRWVRRLKDMDLWNELEARKRWEDGRRKWEEKQNKAGIGVDPTRPETLFDAGFEQERAKKTLEASKSNGAPTTALPSMVDGFETLSMSPVRPVTNSHAERPAPFSDPVYVLNILKNSKSIRGGARQEYGKIYAILAPFYFDLARSRSHTDPQIFRHFREPESQAQMLAQLHVFSKSDWAENWRRREEKVENMIAIFENAVLREFEQGYEAGDTAGRMQRYAHVLHELNGGQAGVEMFIQKHPLFTDKVKLGYSMDCINQASAGSITLEPAQAFFQKLSTSINETIATVNIVFPLPSIVMGEFMEKVGEDILSEYVTPLFDEAHERNVASYLRAVSGLFVQARQFAATLILPKDNGDSFIKLVHDIIGHVFEPHIDLYLQDELDFFKQEAKTQVEDWEKKLSEQDASTESFFMGNVSRVKDKKDFMSSFKKVVMMPVNVLPTNPISFGRAKAVEAETTNGTAPQTPQDSSFPTRTATPSLPDTPASAPTTELAAKAAIMSSKLAGIKTLFSIEVALTLVHAAKTSLERAQHFMKIHGQSGEETREQCLQIFVHLLHILGSRHVQPGFDRAVSHLSSYNPRETKEHDQHSVAPLVTFLELVNVGDLISQMIDVFYEQQLCAPRICDKNDFLDPAVKAKKKWEQMLDERVAAGLNKGIDVLMDEVEYLCATLQQPTDYNPRPASDSNADITDIGPTKCALAIVDLVSTHTKMLIGSTDTQILDVFNQEVGLRLFTQLCKHIKRQRISVSGSILLISDMNLYFNWISTLRNAQLLSYYRALREVSQVFLIDGQSAKEIAEVVADGARFCGVLRAEEVYEFVERRADWYFIKRGVEKYMYGIGCLVM